jgi:hypothetical protein
VNNLLLLHQIKWSKLIKFFNLWVKIMLHLCKKKISIRKREKDDIVVLKQKFENKKVHHDISNKKIEDVPNSTY